MAILMIEYQLPTEAAADYAVWKQVFDADPIGRKEYGAKRHWIYQDHSDPNHFLVSIEFPSAEAAQSFLSDRLLRVSWRISGAGDAWVLKEAEAITY